MAQSGRIGYLVPQFPGQTHIFFWREVLALEARGIEVVLLSTRPPPPGIIAHDWSGAAMARTVYLHRLDPLMALSALPALPWTELPRSGGAALRDMAMSLAAARALVREARARGVEHVHVHSCGRSALIAALASRLGGPSYSLTLHGPLSYFGPAQGFKWRGARFATVVTERLLGEVRETLGTDAPARIVVQAMGVDTDVLRRDAPYRAPAKGEAIRIFSCGRLTPIKGFTDLLEAVRLLLDQGERVTLEIAGEDDLGGSGYRAEVEARIATLGLGDHVTLLGAVDGARVRAGLCAAHLFVLASWEEAIGVALMEAMSCGVPTIGTAVGGVPELIRDGVDGLLVQPRDPAGLADAIRDLARQPKRAEAMAQAGRARVVDRFRADLGAETLIREAGLSTGVTTAGR